MVNVSWSWWVGTLAECTHKGRVPGLIACDRVLHQSFGVGPALELRDALPIDGRAGAEGRPARFARQLFRVARRGGDDGDVARGLSLSVPRDAALVGADESHAGVPILQEEALSESDHPPLKTRNHILRPEPQRPDLG